MEEEGDGVSLGCDHADKLLVGQHLPLGSTLCIRGLDGQRGEILLEIFTEYWL